MRAIGDSFGDRSYVLLHIGFFTCSYHIAFLVTHLPGEVELCGPSPAVASWSLVLIGLANIFDSLYASAWLDGLATVKFGDLTCIWYADMIREAPMPAQARAA